MLRVEVKQRQPPQGAAGTVPGNSRKSSGGFQEVPSALLRVGRPLPVSALVSWLPHLVTPASPTSASGHAALPPGLGSLHFTHPDSHFANPWLPGRVTAQITLFSSPHPSQVVALGTDLASSRLTSI